MVRQEMRFARLRRERLLRHFDPGPVAVAHRLAEGDADLLPARLDIGEPRLALGLAEAAGLAPELRELHPRVPWRYVTARLWPAPLAAVAPDALRPPSPELVIGAGGVAAAVGAGLRRRGARVVQVQHTRMDIR